MSAEMHHLVKMDERSLLRLGDALLMLSGMEVCSFSWRQSDGTLKTVCVLTEEGRVLHFDYTPELAPCCDVYGLGFKLVHKQVQQEFPLDKGLQQVEAESYIGTRATDGHYCLLSKNIIDGEHPLYHSCSTSLNLLLQLALGRID